MYLGRELTTQLHLEQRIRISGAIPLFPLNAFVEGQGQLHFTRAIIFYKNIPYKTYIEAHKHRKIISVHSVFSVIPILSPCVLIINLNIFLSPMAEICC
jgi:hypothetical protein